ncbi:tetratricopeptide repeat protein [Roseiconus lacunae]|uniref:Tetratricopeptide repeat protein n=1 Tax=Roseiconus lacunae TaxID=2605694 RepID=A0ABT7PHE8_9BACT|nr:hypothetical protein [Roseiconus lacunae]MCD0461159.1 hypothetical protein [Roseiconus lacunae]MDM4015921.1 hypothetical protein [Roseiconus lacunae]WRQ51741.1 hypothetical protein U8335_04185 [Stieleria sp. HD01]
MTTEMLYAELSQSIEDGCVEDAIEGLDAICRLNPEDGGAFELRGLLAAQTQRPNLAVLYLERADQLTVLEPLSYRILAFSYIAVGREKQGVELLCRIAVNFADQPWFNRLVARDLLCRGYPDFASDALIQGIGAVPSESETWHELAAVQSVQGESPEKCLDSVSRAIDLAPACVKYRVTASNLLIRLDALDLAYQTVCQVVTADNCEIDCECCLWRLIFLFDCFDDHERMAACYRRLRRSYPSHS